MAFLRRAFLADVVLVAVALLHHRGADVAGASQLLPGGHPIVLAKRFHQGTLLLVGCTTLCGVVLFHHSVLSIEYTYMRGELKTVLSLRNLSCRLLLL